MKIQKNEVLDSKAQETKNEKVKKKSVKRVHIVLLQYTHYYFTLFQSERELLNVIVSLTTKGNFDRTNVRAKNDKTRAPRASRMGREANGITTSQINESIS